MWLSFWMPLTLEGDRIILEGIKTPKRAEKQYQRYWVQPSGGSSEAHPPTTAALFKPGHGQCRALKTSKGALLAWTELEKVIWTQVPVQQRVTATDRDGPQGHCPCPALHSSTPELNTAHLWADPWFTPLVKRQIPVDMSGITVEIPTDTFGPLSLQWQGHMGREDLGVHL